jgi:MSHA biogenesis protein MshP
MTPPVSNALVASAAVSVSAPVFAPAMRRAQAGFSLVSAIFLLVVLAALGAAMVNISTVHQASSALDVQGARAYQAARAGIEWGLYQQLQSQSPAPGDCFGAASFGFPDAPTLRPFTVSVSCTQASGPGALKRWQITAIACNQPAASASGPRCPNPNDSVDYIERKVRVEF